MGVSEPRHTCEVIYSFCAAQHQMAQRPVPVRDPGVGDHCLPLVVTQQIDASMFGSRKMEVLQECVWKGGKCPTQHPKKWHEQISVSM